MVKTRKRGGHIHPTIEELADRIAHSAIPDGYEELLAANESFIAARDGNLKLLADRLASTPEKVTLEERGLLGVLLGAKAPETKRVRVKYDKRVRVKGKLQTLQWEEPVRSPTIPLKPPPSLGRRPSLVKAIHREQIEGFLRAHAQAKAAMQQARAAGKRPGDSDWIWKSNYDWSVEVLIARAQREFSICPSDVRKIMRKLNINY
jgi:hypothetical protein